MDVNTSLMTWKPRLIRLSAIAVPGLCEAHDVYVDPQAISYVGRATPVHTAADGTKTPGSECTLVHCCHYTLWVTDSPAQVAMLRERALGHETEQPKAVIA